MTVEQLGRRIGLPDDGILCAERMLPPEEETRRMLRLLEEDEASFLKELRSSGAPDQLALALFMRYAAEQVPRWLQQGLTETVCYDTFRDITLWYRECVRQTGLAGVVEWDWLILPLKGRLYRLGRLQYQPGTLRETVCAGGRTFVGGAAVLNVHIPADGKLERDAVADSLQQARDFFHEGGYRLFHCHSWLLSPALRDILGSTSNILSFQEFFQVYDEDFSYRQAEERVFGRIGEHPEEYPERTSLQKALKQYLLAGKKVGLGKGVIPFEEP